MILKIAASSVVALALLSAAPAVMAQSSPKSAGTAATKSEKAPKAEQTFIKEAIEGNLAEVKMGELSQQKGDESDVKTYGQMLVKDHGAANEKAKAAAQSAGVTPPSSPSAKQQKTYDMLSKLSGEKFDRQFAEHMIKDHKTAISEYTKAAKGAGPIAEYAKATLPTLKEHLQKAQALQKHETSERPSSK
jgi:putative membrane protein